MKIYLVSEVIAYMDEPMQKRFEVFKTEEDALAYKDWLIESWITDLIETNDCDEDDIEDFIDINYDLPYLWAFTNCDCSEEVEIEISVLDISKIKE